MKRILITGKNSYVGNSFEKWLMHYPDQFHVDKISVRDDTWKVYDFSHYDVILHVAGIAHRKETNENKDLYFRVNKDLTYEIAKKAKEEGVSQFLFLSSMSVYGLEAGIINRDTIPNPKTSYGKSKLSAENLLNKLEDGNFTVTIIRPPMIYGKDCVGNYKRLAKLALKLPFFPNVKNKRSMIYIDNLSELIKLLIVDNRKGLYLPQNEEYVTTSEMVKLIAKAHNKKIMLTKFFNPFIKLLRDIQIINKVFGNLVYEKSISTYYKSYNVVDFEESIYLTESGE